MNNSHRVSLSFHYGMIKVDGFSDAIKLIIDELPSLKFDPRFNGYVTSAMHYHDIIYACIRHQLPVNDMAKAYEALNLSFIGSFKPRTHQEFALKAWVANKWRGVVSLPTGAGKTFLALMAMGTVQRSTLIVVPTIELAKQWCKTIEEAFCIKVGMVGGGEKSWEAVTVITYDSAALTVDVVGQRFGLLIFDECHRLPSQTYRSIAIASLAPLRLGLSATVERDDGLHHDIFKLIGPIVWEENHSSLPANTLAPFEVETIYVRLSDEEQAAYQQARQTYRQHVIRLGIDTRSVFGFNEFIKKASRTPEGRLAIAAQREQKALALCANQKVGEVWRLLKKHADDRMIIFTHDNALAYRVGQQFLLPVLTHHTKPKERAFILEQFRSGQLPVIVASKILNEGVDVPEARVGVVLSGSGTVREHVQRLGRILRHRPGKTAILYEVIAEGTSEEFIKDRRRQHDAYQRFT